MAQNRKEFREETILTHPPEIRLLDGNRPVLAPIYQTAKFAIGKDNPSSSQYIYTRVSNPTLKQLEGTIAELQKVEDCIVLGSGMAAITGTLLGLMEAGDHVVSFVETYRPARIFMRSLIKRFGMDSSVISLKEADQLESYIRPNTKLIYFESPTNPHLEIADIKKIVSIAKKRGVLVVMDGTFGGPHQHRDLGIDVYVHSLTKFVNGHGDVIAGAIAGRKDLIHNIRQMTINLGATLDPHAAYLIQRGLKTYHLRYERAASTSLIIAQFLEKHPKVVKVFYPGLESHPQHKIAKEQMSSFGGIVSFEINSNYTDALTFCQKAQLMQFTASVGSAETLVCPSAAFFGDDLSDEESIALGFNKFTVRVSVGLEHPDDIIADINQALG